MGCLHNNHWLGEQKRLNFMLTDVHGAMVDRTEIIPKMSSRTMK